MKRKLLVILLALAMLVTLTPTVVFADTADDTQYPHWNEDHTQYIVDDIGNVAMGITEIEGNWYYFDDYDGILLKGLQLLSSGGDDYYVYYADEETGILQDGWQNIDGDDYYFQTIDDNNPFRAYTGLTEIDGDAYYFSKQGVMRYGWIETPYYMTDSDGEEYLAGYYRYYADDTGKLLTGWQEIDGNTYCFYEDNYFAYAGGRYNIDGVFCTFDEDGVLIKKEVPDPQLISETLWAGCEYYGPGEYDGDVSDCTLSEVYSSDPDIIEVHIGQNPVDMYDYYLKPLEEGEAEITVWYVKDGESKHTTNLFTVKPFPQFIDSLEIDGEAQATEDYEGINYYDFYEYTGTAPSVKLEPAEGWLLDEGYGFKSKNDDESAGINFEIDPDKIENGWTFDFPEDYDYLCTFYYFRNANTDDEIMFSVQFYREGEGGGDGPVVPAAGHWDESHTHYIYEYGDYATGLSCIAEDGKYKLYYFDEKNGTLKKGWIEETSTWTDEDTGETGTWSNWYYGDPNTGELATGWKKIGSYWYYFTEVDLTEGWDGYLPDLHNHGNEKIGSNWYYLTPGSGRMGTGWIKDVNTYTDESGYTETWTTWYYAHPTSGILQTGWLNLNNKWYYLETREDWDYGAMYTGLRVINGKSYLFDRNSGVMQSGGWVKDTYTWTDGAGKTHTWSNWYYAGSNGVLAEGWRQLGGKWYYFQKGDEYGPGGYMFNNDVYRIDNKLYAFNKDGAMVTGWYQFTWEGYREDGTSVKYTEWTYANSAGIVNTGWQKVSGTWYYFDDWGYMLASDWAEDSRGLCWLEASGKLSTATKWVKYDGEWYHITKGYMDKNKWMKDSKGWCWLTEDGSMLTNGWAKDSKGWCWIAANGYMPTTTQWIKYDGGWYYIEKGYRVQNAWRKDSKGWCYLGPEGRMVTEDFVKDSKGMCWIGEDGYMLVETKVLYLDDGTYGIKDGYMVVNDKLEIDGTVYVFGEDGKLISMGV